MTDVHNTPDSYEAACRVAEQHMPGWTAQRERPKPQPVVSDAQPAPSLAYMKAKIAAQAQNHMVPLEPRAAGGASRVQVTASSWFKAARWLDTPVEFGPTREKFSSPPKICGTTE